MRGVVLGEVRGSVLEALGLALGSVLGGARELVLGGQHSEKDAEVLGCYGRHAGCARVRAGQWAWRPARTSAGRWA